MDQVYVSYIVTEAFLVLFTVSIMLKLNIDVGTEHEVRSLKHIVWAFVAMLLTDMFWAATESGFIHPPRLLYATVNGLFLTSLALACFFWFEMVDGRLHPQRQINKRRRLLRALPILFVLAADVSSIFTGWVFYIDEVGHYIHGSGYTVHLVGAYLYLIISTVEALFFACQSRTTKEQRRVDMVYASFAVPVMAAQVISGYLTGVPILYLCVFLMILILFLTVQQAQISFDGLTGLNNRRRLSQHLSDVLVNAAPESPVTLFMMDVDKFKDINDSYGHVEGDFALKQIAKALECVKREYGGFIARYGGDEFCYVLTDEMFDPPGIVRGIRRALEDVQKESGGQKEYGIQVSVGWHICDSPKETIEYAIAQADAKLYKDKQSRHSGR